MLTRLPTARRGGAGYATRRASRAMPVVALLCAAAATASSLCAADLAGPPLDAHDSAAIAALSVADRESLDRKLRLGLTLYYDGSYRLAQPILQDVASRVDTMDVLHWLGRCALLAGDSDSAIKSFSAMLQRYPTLASVRLELAQAYEQKGDTQRAAEERRLASQPAYNSDNAALAARDDAPARTSRGAGKRFGLQFRGTLGAMYDDNVSVQPDVEKVTLPTGGTLTGTKAIADWASVANLNLDAVYDIDGKNTWYWHNTASYYAQFYHVKRQFDYDQIDLRTGLDWIAPGARLRVPVGFIHRDFGNQQLSDSWYVEPTYERDLSKEWTLLSSYRFESEHFASPLRADQNDRTGTVSVGPAWHRDGDRLSQIVAVKLQLARSLASVAPFSYRDTGIVPSWLGRFSSGLEVLVEGRALQRRFDAPSIFFTDDRTDKRFSVTAIATYPIYKRYLLGAWYSYTKNDSNLSLFPFTKSVVGVNMGIALDK